MVLDKLPVPGRPTIWITVGQGPTALAVGAGGGCLDIFTLIYLFSPLSPSLWETARYRLKYCLKGPLNPRQPTNQFRVNAIISGQYKSINFIQCYLQINMKTVHYLNIITRKSTLYAIEEEYTKVKFVFKFNLSIFSFNDIKRILMLQSV